MFAANDKLRRAALEGPGILKALCTGWMLTAALGGCRDTADAELERGTRYARWSESRPRIIDARAAAKLSLIGKRVEVVTNSRDGAVRCAAALRMGGRQLAERGLLPAPQLASVRQAQGYYESLARKASGFPPSAGLGADLKQAEITLIETPSEVYPLLYSCIQKLAAKAR